MVAASSRIAKSTIHTFTAHTCGPTDCRTSSSTTRIFAGAPTVQDIPYTGFPHERDGAYESLAGVVAREQQAGQLGAGPDTEFAVGACEVGFHGFAGDE
jgi:hypothetical protein